jgi:ABC-type taurine transport system ATPase subunit
VEEALLLSRTVVVMSARPGRVVSVLETHLETATGSRREIVTSPEFVALKEQALEALE